MALFESMSGAKVKDCIENDKLIFIVEENEMGRAIGKNGANIKRMENILKKKIRLIEFSGDIVQFVRNLIYPAEALDIKKDDGIVTIYGKDTGARAMLIGRERQNIKNINSIAKRYFDISEVKVV